MCRWQKNNASKSGNYGDIDLFGFKKSPTLDEKRKRLENEKNAVKQLADTLDTLSVCQKNMLDQIPNDKCQEIIIRLLEIIRIIGERIRDLRKTKVHIDLTLERLKKQSGPDWRKSKYVMVISFLETDLYDVCGCITDLLKCSE